MSESPEQLFAKLRKVVGEPDSPEAQEIVREAEEAIARDAGVRFTDTLEHTSPLPRENKPAAAKEENRMEKLEEKTDWYRAQEKQREADEDRRAGRSNDSDIVIEN